MSALAGAHEQVGNGQKGIAEAGFHDRTVALIINAGNIFVFFIKFPTKYGIQLLAGGITVRLVISRKDKGTVDAVRNKAVEGVGKLIQQRNQFRAIVGRIDSG